MHAVGFLQLKTLTGGSQLWERMSRQSALHSDVRTSDCERGPVSSLVQQIGAGRVMRGRSSLPRRCAHHIKSAIWSQFAGSHCSLRRSSWVCSLRESLSPEKSRANRRSARHGAHVEAALGTREETPCAD